jgi:DnaK suppressor protein
MRKTLEKTLVVAKDSSKSTTADKQKHSAIDVIKTVIVAAEPRADEAKVTIKIKKKKILLKNPAVAKTELNPLAKISKKIVKTEVKNTVQTTSIKSLKNSKNSTSVKPEKPRNAMAASALRAVTTKIVKPNYVSLVVSPMVIDAVEASEVKKNPKLAKQWKIKKPEDLTDEELLAMSDDEYMNDAQLGAFKHRLIKMKNGILSSAGATTEYLKEDSQLTSDPADRATIEEEHALELRARDRERKLLKKINESISRINAGDYGFCDETGESIGIPRLLARLTANLSLEAQQRRELRQRMFGD